MNNLAQLGCYAPLDDTKVIDPSDLREKNTNLETISTTIMEWYYDKLRQREGIFKNLSITYPSNLIGEMARDHLGLKNVFSALNLPFLPLNNLSFRNVELKTDITEKAMEFLKADMFICDMIAEIVEEVEDFLSGRQYKMSLHIDHDLEIFDFEKLVLSIEVDEEDYDQILELWDEIEEVVGKILNNRKKRGYEASRIDGISETLLIKTKRM